MAELKKSQYEPLLKEDLTCFRCGHTMKNIPTLKVHLQEEWDKGAAREKAKLERKRKREEHNDDQAKKKHEADKAAVESEIGEL